MSDDTPILQKTKSETKKKNLPQLFLVAANAFSLVYAVEVGVFSIVMAILALVTGGITGGFLAYYPFWFGISAVVFGLIAFWTMKKITDKDLLKKAYGVAAAFLMVEVIFTATAAISVIPFALFAVGAGGAVQQALWLNMFLPFFGAAAVMAGLLAAVKKIFDGYVKLLPIMTYIVFAVAGIALILAIIATFVGLYGGSGGSYYYY
jgi:uncharacterized membrane protein YwzB